MISILALLVFFLFVGLFARKLNAWTRILVIVVIAGMIVHLAIS